MQPDALSSKLNQLVKAYCERLPAITAELEQHWQDLQNEPFDVSSLQALLAKLHSIKGSSGTFGLRALSQNTARYEDVAKDCEQKYNGGFLAPDELLSLLEPFHRTLLDVIAESKEDTSPLIPEMDDDMTRQQHQRHSVLYIPPIKDTSLSNTYIQAIEAEGIKVTRQSVRKLSELPNLSKLASVAVVEADHSDDQILSLLLPLQLLKEAGVMSIVLTDLSDMDTQLALVRASVDSCVIRPATTDDVLRPLLRLVAEADQPMLRILIVDDQLDVAEYYQALLREEGMTVAIESNPLSLIHKIDQFEPDVLILDIHMPIANGPEIAQMLRMHERYSTLPILFLSGDHYEAEQRSHFIGIGTDDLLEKGMPRSELVQQVRNRAQRAKILKHQVTTDGLTGIYNHRHIMQQARWYCRLAKRSKQPLALVLIDLDHFKQVNDQYGHDVGDMVLRKLSRFLRERLRETDLVGRYGGEEFIILLPNTNKTTAKKLIETLLVDFKLEAFSTPQGDFMASFSAGVSDTQFSHELNVLFKSMDEALYRAKEAGRCRVECAEELAQ